MRQTTHNSTECSKTHTHTHEHKPPVNNNIAETQKKEKIEEVYGSNKRKINTNCELDVQFSEIIIKPKRFSLSLVRILSK